MKVWLEKENETSRNEVEMERTSQHATVPLMRHVFEMDIEKVDIGKRSILEPCLTAPAPGHKGIILSVTIRVL